MNKYARLVNEVYNDVRRMLNESEWEEYNDNRPIYDEDPPEEEFREIEFYYNINQDSICHFDDLYLAKAGDRLVPVTAYAIPEYYRGEFEGFSIGLDVDTRSYIVPEGEDWDDPIEEPGRFEGLTKQQKESIISKLDPNDFWAW